jgi:hypothetical protein
MAANTPSAGSGGSRGIAGDATASGKAFMPPPNPALAAVYRRLACTTKVLATIKSSRGARRIAALSP